MMENWDPFCEVGDELMVCKLERIRPKGEAGYGDIPGFEMFRRWFIISTKWREYMILNALSGFFAFLFCFLRILGLAQKSAHMQHFMKLISHSAYKPSTDTADVTGRWI